jgi:hypothetical protein
MAQKNKDVSGSETPEGTAPKGAKATHGASKLPIWSLTINRVDASIWKYDHEDGATYSIAISRSYFDKKSNEVKRNHYFDLSDLADVRTISATAEEYIHKLRDAAQTVS